MIVEFNEQRATLFCTGDEDRTTQGLRRSALSRAIRAQTDVIVDLSELAFADSSLMLDLAMVARRLRVRERKLMLRLPQPHIKMLIELVGLHRLPGVRLEVTRARAARDATSKAAVPAA